MHLKIISGNMLDSNTIYRKHACYCKKLGEMIHLHMEHHTALHMIIMKTQRENVS